MENRGLFSNPAKCGDFHHCDFSVLKSIVTISLNEVLLWLRIFGRSSDIIHHRPEILF